MALFPWGAHEHRPPADMNISYIFWTVHLMLSVYFTSFGPGLPAGHFGSLGITVVVPQIWGCQRAYARSHPQIWDYITEIPKDPIINLTTFEYSLLK
jgi:hypothetical protein